MVSGFFSCKVQELNPQATKDDVYREAFQKFICEILRAGLMGKELVVFLYDGGTIILLVWGLDKKLRTEIRVRRRKEEKPASPTGPIRIHLFGTCFHSPKR